MASRPNLPARDSSGRKVSLLNDDIPHDSRHIFRNPEYVPNSNMVRSDSNFSGISNFSSPRTPGLLRADSYDSQTTNDPASPITPVFMERQNSYTSAGYAKGAPSQYEQQQERGYDYPYPSNQQYHSQMTSQFADTRTSYVDTPAYEEDFPNTMANERTGKRYPCRFRAEHHCEKTFTTSGHASRHSKIHTAEKAVHCSFLHCTKKFTRSDNMKQHLETHYKHNDKRTSSQKPPSSSSSSSSASNTNPSSAPSNHPSRISLHGAITKRTATPRSRPPSRNLPSSSTTQDMSSYDPALFASPHVAPSMDMRGMQSALVARPVSARDENASMDLLATVAALHQS